MKTKPVIRLACVAAILIFTASAIAQESTPELFRSKVRPALTYPTDAPGNSQDNLAFHINTINTESNNIIAEWIDWLRSGGNPGHVIDSNANTPAHYAAVNRLDLLHEVIQSGAACNAKTGMGQLRCILPLRR